MNETDFHKLVLERFIQWPSLGKYAVLFFLFILTVLTSHWLILSSKVDQYRYLVNEGIALKTEFKEKRELANLDKYREQLESIKRRYITQIKSLAASNEISALLNKISKAGQSTDLVFEFFAPKHDDGKTVFNGLIIYIVAVGEYRNLVLFLRKLSNFHKLIAFDNFDIYSEVVHEKRRLEKKAYNHLLRMKIKIKIPKFPESN